MEDQMENIFTCPYRNCGLIFDDAMTFDLHLRFCRTQNVCELTICQSNHMHVVPKLEMAYHAKMCCNKDKGVDKFINQIHQLMLDLGRRQAMDRRKKIGQTEGEDQIVPSIRIVAQKDDFVV
uniref:C2H2-type domain-containing protein n=1 Tax=Romanomermis culicivorax TaxID=13658 RepID=A0A915K3K2_ROMCU